MAKNPTARFLLLFLCIAHELRNKSNCRQGSFEALTAVDFANVLLSSEGSCLKQLALSNAFHEFFRRDEEELPLQRR